MDLIDNAGFAQKWTQEGNWPLEMCFAGKGISKLDCPKLTWNLKSTYTPENQHGTQKGNLQDDFPLRYVVIFRLNKITLLEPPPDSPRNPPSKAKANPNH